MRQIFNIKSFGFCLWFAASPVFANSISYSGRLTEANGKPIAGPVELLIKFYSSATGGSPLLGELTKSNVSLQDGVFQVDLDLNSSELTTILGNGTSPVFIEITQGSVAHPRQRFMAVPFALRVPVDGSSINYNASGELQVNSIPASKVTGLTSATATTLGGLAFDQSSVANGKVIKWDATNNKYYLADDSTSGAGGVISATSVSADNYTSNGQAGVLISPYGSNAGETGELRFGELNGIGSNYVALKAPDSVASNLTFTLPSSYGSPNQVLKTDGIGNLSWTSVTSGTVTNVSVTSPLTISNPTSTPSITLPQAASGVSGYLSATDWAAFNAKQASLAQATSVSNGYLTSSDWLTFNDKEPALAAGTPSQYYRGDKSWQTLNSTAVTEGTTYTSLIRGQEAQL